MGNIVQFENIKVDGHNVKFAMRLGFEEDDDRWQFETNRIVESLSNACRPRIECVQPVSFDKEDGDLFANYEFFARYDTVYMLMHYDKIVSPIAFARGIKDAET